ncbi:MAG TPA: rRNA maturation RNase YbeY [Tepidisphaeraceae bacterium]|jgi:probable rRNA maturation factor
MKAERFQLDITPETGGRRYIPFLKKMLVRARREIRSCPAEISILIAGAGTMSRLHKDFMGIAGPTDVLTFEIARSRAGHVIMGEIVVCLPIAQKQAKARHIPVSHELLLYTLHGMLHLSGYDDLNQRDFERMHKEEDRILNALGIGPVFVRDAKRH